MIQLSKIGWKWIFCLLLATFALASCQASTPVSRVVDVPVARQGDFRLLSVTEGWVTPSPDKALQVGDRVQALSPAVFQLQDGTLLRLAAGSELTFLTFRGRELEVHLAVGAGVVDTPNPGFVLITPLVTVRVHGTSYRVEVRSPDETYVAADAGSVLVSRGLDTALVQEGQETRVFADQPLAVLWQALPTPSPTPVPTATPAATATAASTPTPTPIIHIVQEGETVSSIANQYGVPPQFIIEANHLDNPGLLQVGQELIIPAVEPETP